MVLREFNLDKSHPVFEAPSSFRAQRGRAGPDDLMRFIPTEWFYVFSKDFWLWIQIHNLTWFFLLFACNCGILFTTIFVSQIVRYFLCILIYTSRHEHRSIVNTHIYILKSAFISWFKSRTKKFISVKIFRCVKTFLHFIFWKLKIWLGISEFHNGDTRKYKNFWETPKY